jgi:hypothetical protein
MVDHGGRLGLDRDSALPLHLQRVGELRLGLLLLRRNVARLLQQAVRERGLAWAVMAWKWGYQEDEEEV